MRILLEGILIGILITLFCIAVYLVWREGGK